MVDTFLTVEEAAKRLAVTPYTLREWLRGGKLRGVQVARRWRVPERALFELATATPSQATGDASTPQTRAVQILADFRCGDIRKRNAAILRLGRSDAQTRALVEREVEKSMAAYDGPDDDFADCHALDGEPFRFPEEPDDFLDGLYADPALNANGDAT